MVEEVEQVPHHTIRCNAGIALADAIVVTTMPPANDPDGPKFGHAEIDGVGATSGTRAAQGTEAVEAADSADAVESAQEVGSEAVAGADAIMAQQIAAGALDAEQATAQLIDEVVRAQLPEGSPAQIEALKSELAILLVDDPTLAGLLRP